MLAVPASLEVILVDDGSRDGTWTRMQRWAENERVQALRHERPREARERLSAPPRPWHGGRSSLPCRTPTWSTRYIGDYPRRPLDPTVGGAAQVV